MKLTYYAAMTLDGFIATEDGGVGYLDAYNENDEELGFDEFFGSIDALVMGSGTYEFMLAHPPWMAPDKPSWVLTTRDLPSMDSSITLTSESPEEVIAAMKEQGVQHAWFMGGGKLAASFREKDLITHYSIHVIPVILGKGIPLLENADAFDALKLTSTGSFSSGIVALNYEVNPREK